MRGLKLIALLGVVACSGSENGTAPAPPTDPASFEGLYLLRTIDGTKLPAAGWTYGNVNFQVFTYPTPRAAYVLNKNGATVETGTYTANGLSYSLTSGTANWSAKWDGRDQVSMTASGTGQAMVFTR